MARVRTANEPLVGRQAKAEDGLAYLHGNGDPPIPLFLSLLAVSGSTPKRNPKDIYAMIGLKLEF